jgi:hypothetical protein
MSEKKMVVLIAFLLVMFASLLTYVENTSKDIVKYLYLQKISGKTANISQASAVAEVTASDFEKEGTSTENTVYANPKEELNSLILKKLEKADTEEKFSQLFSISVKYGLTKTVGVVEDKWDEWAIIQIKNAKTVEELLRLGNIGAPWGKAWEEKKERLLRFEIERLKKELSEE